jgi:hypothetical protein
MGSIYLQERLDSFLLLLCGEGVSLLRGAGVGAGGLLRLWFVKLRLPLVASVEQYGFCVGGCGFLTLLEQNILQESEKLAADVVLLPRVP